MVSLAEVVGGSIAILFLSWLVEWAICKRVMDNQRNGIIASIVGAWLLASVLYGFGAADGGPWRKDGFLIYGMAAIIVFAGRLFRFHTQKDKSENLADIFE